MIPPPKTATVSAIYIQQGDSRFQRILKNLCSLFPVIVLSLTQLRTADSSIQALFSFTNSDYRHI